MAIRGAINQKTNNPPVLSCRPRYFIEVVHKHSGGKGKDTLSRRLEAGTQLLPVTGNGQPNPTPGSTDPVDTVRAESGDRVGGRSYQRLPSIATSALAGVGQQGDVPEESGGTDGERQGDGDASRKEAGALEFAMV